MHTGAVGTSRAIFQGVGPNTIIINIHGDITSFQGDSRPNETTFMLKLFLLQLGSLLFTLLLLIFIGSLLCSTNSNNYKGPMKAGPFRWSGAHCVAVGTSATSCTSYSVNSGFTINYSVITATISFTTSNITISYSTIITTNYIIIGVNNNTHTITDNSMHTTINVNNVGVNNIPDDTTIIGVNITDNSDSTNIGVNTSCNTSTNTIDSIDSTIDGNTNDSTICPDSCSST